MSTSIKHLGKLRRESVQRCQREREKNKKKLRIFDIVNGGITNIKQVASIRPTPPSPVNSNGLYLVFTE